MQVSYSNKVDDTGPHKMKSHSYLVSLTFSHFLSKLKEYWEKCEAGNIFRECEVMNGSNGWGKYRHLIFFRGDWLWCDVVAD